MIPPLQPDTVSPPDVLIVGAGPAGAVSAALLAEAGLTVHLLDRAEHPRPKACGECLNPGAVAALDRLGFLDAVLARSPAPLVGWRLCTETGREAVGSFAPEGRTALAIPRAELDQALVQEAVARGARLFEGVQVRRAMSPGSGHAPSAAHLGKTRQGTAVGQCARPSVRTIERDGSSAVRSARLVIGADGLRSMVARALGPPARSRIRKLSLTCRLHGQGPPEDRGTLWLGDGITVGLALVHPNRGLWNGTVVVDSDRFGADVRRDPLGFYRRALEGARLGWRSPPEVVEGPWASGPFDRARSRFTTDGILLVGDASGYFDPLTGQGIFRALRAAELAAETVRNCLPVGGDGVPTRSELLPYERAVKREFRPGRRLQRVIDRALAHRVPRNALVGHLGAAPEVTDRLVRVIGDAAAARTLFHPRVAAGLLGFAYPLERPRRVT